jgi:hypothetical protein
MDLAALATGVLHHPDPAPPAVALAADELARYLGRMVGAMPRRMGHAAPGGAWLCLAPAGVPPPARALGAPVDAELAVTPADGTLVLTGDGPRALLSAVYALLEAAGCRWSPWGATEEDVPDRGRARLALPTIRRRPAFARRAYAADLATWHYAMPERLAERLPADLAFVDWMAKSGGTGLLFIRHANDTQWVLPELVPALRSRGLEVEGGGHALVELLPRELFASHPEFFPARADGTRTDWGNVCGASDAALAVVAERARAARDALPGTSDLHLWGLDLWDGGWCRCAACAAATPSEQLLRVCNHVADALGGAGVHHLAYHDTLRVPRGVRPGPTVRAEFAPRERCYAHALDDAGCARNAPYREALAQHVELFDGRVDVFEYYGDAILFGGTAVPLVEVIARDLEHYRRSGVRGVSCLVFGTYSLWAYGVNVEAFARGALEPARAREARETSCTRRFGAAADPMRGYLESLERLMSTVVTYGDVQLPPRRPAAAAAVHASLGAALERGDGLRGLLAQAIARSGGADVRRRVVAEERLLDYTLATLGGVRDWLGARLGRGAAPDDLERAIETIRAAITHVVATEREFAGTWGAYDLEITQAFFAAALRDPPDDAEPF